MLLNMRMKPAVRAISVVRAENLQRLDFGGEGGIRTLGTR